MKKRKTIVRKTENQVGWEMASGCDGRPSRVCSYSYVKDNIDSAFNDNSGKDYLEEKEEESRLNGIRNTDQIEKIHQVKNIMDCYFKKIWHELQLAEKERDKQRQEIHKIRKELRDCRTQLAEIKEVIIRISYCVYPDVTNCTWSGVLKQWRKLSEKKAKVLRKEFWDKMF